jgi:hypothetical protein
LDPDSIAALGVGGVCDGVVVFAEAFCEDVPGRENVSVGCRCGKKIEV